MTNPFKARIAQDSMILAAWAELGSPDTAEIMVRHGWNAIIIDGEHGRGDLEQWVHMARAVESAGGTAILRLPDGDDTRIKRALDRGFRNFVVPMVNTRAEAERIASAFYYPLRGHRGYAAPIVRGSDWGAREAYASQEAHDDLVVMVQCEHVEAVENLDEIMQVPGIDMIFVGPNDLAATAGHLEHLDHPDVLALLARIEETAARHGKPLATVRSAGRDWNELDALGYRLVAGVNDVSMVIDTSRAELAAATGQIATKIAGY
ncbi:HpcH/HpaI aldolase family protein [Primorskyibacter sp. 2E233]|uniref:HpcH/HpaI aldolase family protein n=1 Tax=Primorskyibacter sp. 2E233 TaxID=3413431 RepID=UPI003BF12368